MDFVLLSFHFGMSLFNGPFKLLKLSGIVVTISNGSFNFLLPFGPRFGVYQSLMHIMRTSLMRRFSFLEAQLFHQNSFMRTQAFSK